MPLRLRFMQLQSIPKHPREINPGIPIGLGADYYEGNGKVVRQIHFCRRNAFDIERFRLNPSIVFDYGNKSLLIISPQSLFTLCDSGVRNKIHNEATKVVDMPQDDVVVKEEQFADEDFVKEHKSSHYAVKGIVIAAVAVCAIFFALAMFRRLFNLTG